MAAQCFLVDRVHVSRGDIEYSLRQHGLDRVAHAPSATVFPTRVATSLSRTRRLSACLRRSDPPASDTISPAAKVGSTLRRLHVANDSDEASRDATAGPCWRNGASSRLLQEFRARRRTLVIEQGQWPRTTGKAKTTSAVAQRSLVLSAQGLLRNGGGTMAVANQRYMNADDSGNAGFRC